MKPQPLGTLLPKTATVRPAPLFAGKKDNETILKPLVVEGQGTARRNPDVMHITLSMKEEGKEKPTVSQAISQRAAALFAAIRALSLPFITQPALHVNEKTRYDHQSGEQVNEGYTGIYQLTLQEENKQPDAFADHAGLVRKVAEEHQADFHGPAFSLSPQRFEEGQREANGIAYKNARRSAQAVAKAGNFSIANEPLEVKIGEVETYQPARHGRAALASAAPEAAFADNAGGGVSGSELFEFKPIEVPSKRVRAVFQIDPPGSKTPDPIPAEPKAKKDKKAK